LRPMKTSIHINWNILYLLHIIIIKITKIMTKTIELYNLMMLALTAVNVMSLQQ